MSIEGQIKLLHLDDENINVFPLTKMKAVSDDNNKGLDAILADMNTEIDKKASQAFVTNAIANAQLGGDSSEIDLSGYATKDDIANIDYPVDSVNGKTGAVSLTASDVGAAPTGYGLGESVLFSATDIDSITNPGWYFTNNSLTINGFTNIRWWMIVKAYSTGVNFAVQEIYTFYKNHIYTLSRGKINGTWTEWVWTNPMLIDGIEYATRDAHNGNLIYRQKVDIGNLPVSSLKFVYPAIPIPPEAGLYNMYGIVYQNEGYRTSIHLQPHLNITITSGDGMYRLDITTTSDLSHLKGWVVLEYIKE